MRSVLSIGEGGEASSLEGSRTKGTRGEWKNGRVFASVRGWGNGGFSEGFKGSKGLLLIIFRSASVIYWCLGA